MTATKAIFTVRTCWRKLVKTNIGSNYIYQPKYSSLFKFLRKADNYNWRRYTGSQILEGKT